MSDQPKVNLTQPHSAAPRLAHLDGVRGLAALYVLLFHVVANGDMALALHPFMLNFLRFGHEAVVVFIVLSGFLLSIPVARSSQIQLRDGLGGFFKRRTRRIMPGYYASLFMFPLFIAAVELLKQATGEGADWARLQSIFLSGNMLSHLLLVHNLSPVWATSPEFNVVLWSMATEWWIYFVFALLLIPVWRRFGVFTAACAAFLLSLVPWIMNSLGWPTLAASPHLLAGYGLGMASAALIFSPKYANQRLVWRRAFRIVTPAAFVLFCFLSISVPELRLHPYNRWITDLILAFTCTGFIVLTTSNMVGEQTAKGLPAKAARLLSTRPLILLGAFSYSLYLTHLVVWAILGISLGLAPVQRIVNFSLDPLPARILVLIPIQLLFAYGFYTLFERPFLSSRAKQVPTSHSEEIRSLKPG